MVKKRVFLTAVVENDQGLMNRDLMAFDVLDGTPLFRTTVFTDVEYRGHRQNTNASATPASDGSSVYVFFGSTLGAVDVDGELLWSQTVDPLYAKYAHWGSASSPVLFEDLVIAFQDTEKARDEKEGWLGAFDKGTGREVWRLRWRDTCCSYTTPVLWDRDGEIDLVVAHSGFVRAYDPRTGDARWSHSYDINQSVASPVVAGDLLCTLGGAHNIQGNYCFVVSGRSPNVTVEQLWWDGHSVPEDASPVLYDQRIFAVTTRGVMTAYDAQKGSVLWRSRLPTRAHHSSLIAGDGKVYALSSIGRMIVVDATSDDFAVLADNDLGEAATNASPVVAGNWLLIRTEQNLVCIEGSPRDDALRNGAPSSS